MKPSLPMNRYKPPSPGGFTVHATESTKSKSHKWSSKTFTDIDVRLVADSEPEYDLPNEDEDEQSHDNHEYEASPSLEDLRHMSIWPAKPMNVPSVYADKRCLPMKPCPFYPKESLPPCPRPQAPYAQCRSSNMQREKRSSDSHARFVARGPAVNRDVKPSKTARDTFDAPEKTPKQPTRPLPRPPRTAPKEFKQHPPVASNSYVSSGSDNALHSINMPSVTQPENDRGLWKNNQNKAIIPRNGAGFRSLPEVIPPMRKQPSVPQGLIFRSSSPASSSNQTSHISGDRLQDTSTQSKQKYSSDLLNDKHFPNPGPRDLEGNIWYIGTYNRHEAEEALRMYNKNGAFMVRDSSKGIPDKPYVLLVYNNYKVYSIQIRYLESSRQYTLGSGLRGYDVFDSVPHIIEIHKSIPLRLIDGRDQSGSQMEQCILTVPLILR